MTEKSSRKLFLIDAYALIYRSYFAFIRSPRINLKGVNTSATYGFANTLIQLLETEKPQYIGVVFDMSTPTFRHDLFPDYKANRQEMPEDLRKSVPYIRKMIEALNIPIIEKEGFEADDIIGTLAKKAESEGFLIYMMTPDKDYAQLVSENIFMYKPGKSGNDNEIWGVEEVKKNFEIDSTSQMIDLLGLMGDSSDNIPGCPGIGPKNAQKLIHDFGNIDGIYQNIDQIKGKQKENLIEFEQQVRLSRLLANTGRWSGQSCQLPRRLSCRCLVPLGTASQHPRWASHPLRQNHLCLERHRVRRHPSWDSNHHRCRCHRSATRLSCHRFHCQCVCHGNDLC